jgi:hypothetical protein
LRELARSTQLLEAQKAQKLEAERTTEQRLREAHQAVLPAQDRIDDHVKKIGLFEQQNTKLRKPLEERGSLRHLCLSQAWAEVQQLAFLYGCHGRVGMCGDKFSGVR